MVKIICGCKQLVEVVDKKIVDHQVDGGRCPASGLRYISKKIKSPFAGGPNIEIVAAGEISCDSCGEKGLLVLGQVNSPDPNLN